MTRIYCDFCGREMCSNERMRIHNAQQDDACPECYETYMGIRDKYEKKYRELGKQIDEEQREEVAKLRDK
jgi:hypothetical protein